MSNATKAFEYIKTKYNVDLAKEERLLKKLKSYVLNIFKMCDKKLTANKSA